MGADITRLRVLQIIGTTDADDVNCAAVDLHQGLSRRGAEVRTLALAPGRDAGLGAQVPSMAPSVKSLSAHTQFRREQRWADVVVLHGAAPAAAAGVAAIRNAAPTVLVLGDDAARWRDAPVPSRAMRVVSGAAAIVVCADADGDLGPRLGLDPSSVQVLRTGVAVGAIVTPARRSAARRSLGIDEHRIVAHLPLPDSGSGAFDAGDAVMSAAALLDVHWTRPQLAHGQVVHFGETDAPDHDELAFAAADVVVHAGGATSGPARSLLVGAAAGLAPVASAAGGGDLVDSTTGWESLTEAVDAGVEEIRRRGARAAARVAQRHDLSVSVDRWSDLLASVQR